MFNLSVLSIFAVFYIALLITKMLISWPSFEFIARERLQHNLMESPEDMTMDEYIRRVQFFYSVGAAFSLIILLIPTLYQEGFSFFKAYSEQQLKVFAETDE